MLGGGGWKGFKEGSFFRKKKRISEGWSLNQHCLKEIHIAVRDVWGESGHANEREVTDWGADFLSPKAVNPKKLLNSKQNWIFLPCAVYWNVCKREKCAETEVKKHLYHSLWNFIKQRQIYTKISESYFYKPTTKYRMTYINNQLVHTY
jgi:hypothetical protein